MRVELIAILCLTYITGFSQNVTVLPNGNMGLTTTNPLERFQIGNNWTFHDGGSKFIGNNIYYSDADRRIVGGNASQIRFDYNGQIHFLLAPNGSTNSLFNPTTKFNIALNGLVKLESNNTLSFKVNNPGVEIGSSTGKIDFWYSSSTGHHHLFAKRYNKVSDKRLKTNISDITNSIALIQSLKGKSYRLKSNGESDFGLLAQDVEKILPEIVSESQQYKTIDYSSLIPILIEAIKEQQVQIDELKNRLN